MAVGDSEWKPGDNVRAANVYNKYGKNGIKFEIM